MSTRLRTVACIAATLGCSITTAAVGQFPGTAGASSGGGSGRHILRVGFGGGMSVPTQHAADAFKTGVNGEGYLLIDLGFLPPIRLNAGYQKFDYKELLTGQSQGTTSILSGVGGLEVTIIPFGPIRPYVTAGLGAFHVSDDINVTSGTASPTAPPTSAIKFGVDGGAGVRLRFGRLEGFVEGKVQNVYTDQGVIDRKTITSIPVTFGILF